MGTAFELPVTDIEADNFAGRHEFLSGLLSRLKPGVKLRFISQKQARFESDQKNTRQSHLATLGWMDHGCFLFVEGDRARGMGIRDWWRGLTGKPLLSVSREAAHLKECADFAAIRELGGKPLDEKKIGAFFPPQNRDYVAGQGGLDAGTGVIGVLRLWRQGTLGLDRDTLAILNESIPAPHEICVSIKKISDVRAQYILQRKRGQLAASNDTLSGRQYANTDEIAAKTLQAGKGLVEIEWLLILRRKAEESLRTDLHTAERALSILGDLYIETKGVLPSYAASIPGGQAHHNFMELDDVAAYFLPVFSRGEGTGAGIGMPSRALPLHRRDGSLYFFDLWRKGYDGANCIINGRRGKGKSVLANLISTALLDDPLVKLIKVDVGGSYVKECSLAGGRHVQFNLSEPSGLNPFSVLSQTAFIQDAAVVLSGFLSTLILENRERELSKEMLGAVERIVLSYAGTKPNNPSLTHFLSHAKGDIPRRGLLDRFGPDGVYSNVLKDTPDGAKILDDRYVYFNFERLQNAANEDFAQAVMASVIASVNMEVLRAGDARRGADTKVVFFADETPFFIQRNGRFFKLTTANFRKFGHATILIAQTTKDFELPKEDGTTDYGILINSPIRFLYQVDDAVDGFAERFALTAGQITEIQNLGRSQKYREVFLQDELGGRVLRVAVTPEEYWRVTSSREDNEKLQTLLKTVPGLTLQEAIRCMSVSA